ncbi:MAG: FtsX-like permease family protein, partial [Bacteroidota bacterium]
NFHNQSLHDPLEAQLLFFSPSGSQVYVKLKEDVSTALAHVETSWKRVYPNADFSFEFLDQMIQEAYQADERRGRIFLSFSLVTLIIAFLGLFGLASYLSRQRIREMGIRRVLGAELSDVVMLLSRDFLLLVCIAAIPAFVAAWWLIGQWLEEFAFRIDMHVGVFVGVFLFTLLLVFLTTAYHAVRSGRINPAESLKHE